MSSIIKSKEPLRNAADILECAKSDQAYKSIFGQLLSAIIPGDSFSALTDISMQVAGIIGRHLGKVHDVPLGTVVHSFTRLHGDLDTLGITPIEISTRNVDFNFELVVRDSNRQNNRCLIDLTPM
jgi:hypothetical protein